MTVYRFAVRKAGGQDIEQAAELFNAYRMFYGQEPDMEGARAFLTERLSRNESVFFIVWDEATGRAAGFTQLYPSFSSVSMKPVWTLNDLYVREEFRGKGAVQLLMEESRRLAAATGAKGLQLSTAIDNKRAQAVYERCGYKRDEEFYTYSLTF
ncbi:GNAT family N-acetyltransferase [Paenibacillus sambharensis]|uniref:GNAT family N-acetyltransferase n=1 Tax=Paenibacillus sambharensis TaxID=1803190 RepID=A0A2W1LME8_9BACL|nr:GNAT family N-acetyltransferase [Paenibacillus sambharensis]PZD96055.1 GNAT family N-acetyltransferase [Paenibacillus sambharensis]